MSGVLDSRLPVPRSADGRVLELGAVGLAAEVAKGALSARETVALSLERIEACNRFVNAVPTLVPAALARAERLDAIFAQNGPVGPLHGVPFTAKDVLATRGVRTTAGSRLLKDWVPNYSAVAIERLEAAGAILVGKSNCPEFALDMHTDNRVFGGTWNPVSLERTSGGSSGGDSAAVAALCVPFGLGTDYGGSLRWPAHCTGICALRPSVGSVPRGGQVPYPFADRQVCADEFSLQGWTQVIGPLGRDIETLEVVLEVLRGADPSDVLSYHSRLDGAHDDLTGTRVAVLASEGSVPVRADLVGAIVTAGERLGGEGMRVLEARPRRFSEAAPLFSELRRRLGPPAFVVEHQDRYDEFSAPIQSLLNRAARSDREVRSLLRERAAVQEEVLRFMTSVDVLILPVASLPAVVPGDDEYEVDGRSVPALEIIACSRAVSFLGFPAVAVRCGTSAEGLPIAAQVVARPGEERLALAVARRLER